MLRQHSLAPAYQKYASAVSEVALLDVHFLCHGLQGRIEGWDAEFVCV